MKKISDYLLEAMEHDGNYAYDQWDFRWSAKEVAKRAAMRGEISWGNVGWLAKAIVLAKDVYDKKMAEKRQHDIALAKEIFFTVATQQGLTPAQIEAGIFRIENGAPVKNVIEDLIGQQKQEKNS